jgi:hypothetical protein
MLFCKDYRDQVAAEVGSAAPNVVSKALGEKWAQTTDRHTWEQQAEKDKARYDKEMAAHTAMLDEEAAEVRRERDAAAAGPSDRDAERSLKRQQLQEELAKREVRAGDIAETEREGLRDEEGCAGEGVTCGAERAACRVPSAAGPPLSPQPTLAPPSGGVP